MRETDMVEENKRRAELGAVRVPSRWDVFVDNLMLLIIFGAVGVLVWKIIEFAKAMSV